MKSFRLSVSFVALSAALFFISCSSPINSISDPHFDEDGVFLDSLGATFKAEIPSNVAFYVEVSGSMNGFFRANQPTSFKADVWSIVSNFGNPGVSVLTDTGKDAHHYSGQEFRERMNGGKFTSEAETKVPDMLKKILENHDMNAVSVLISDMKYSPERAHDAAVLLEQYETDIRNLVGGNCPGVAYSLIGAYSDYLDKRGNVVCERSPYYYLVIGKGEYVAEVRNCITTILSEKNNYLDNIETGFDYKRPAYGFGVPDNAIQFDEEPTFYNYDVSYSDTCKVILNIDLSDFRWLIASDEGLLRKCLNVKAAYGSELEVGKIDIQIDNHLNKELDRLAVASVELKLWNMPMGADVIEWSIDHPEHVMTQTFINVQNAAQENDLTGSYSLNRFISGMFAGLQNTWDKEPYRILISKSN
jgi:hypothetical protein